MTYVDPFGVARSGLVSKARGSEIVRAGHRIRIHNDRDQILDPREDPNGGFAPGWPAAETKKKRGAYKILTEDSKPKRRPEVHYRPSPVALITAPIVAGSGAAVAATHERKSVGKADASRKKAIWWNPDVNPRSPQGRANYRVVTRERTKGSLKGLAAGTAAGAGAGALIARKPGAVIGSIFGGTAGQFTGDYRGHMKAQRDPRYKPLPKKVEKMRDAFGVDRPDLVEKAAFGELLKPVKSFAGGFRHGVGGGSFGQAKGGTAGMFGAKLGNQAAPLAGKLKPIGQEMKEHKTALLVGTGAGIVGGGGLSHANKGDRPRYGPGW